MDRWTMRDRQMGNRQMSREDCWCREAESRFLPPCQQQIYNTRNIYFTTLRGSGGSARCHRRPACSAEPADTLDTVIISRGGKPAAAGSRDIAGKRRHPRDAHANRSRTARKTDGAGGKARCQAVLRGFCGYRWEWGLMLLLVAAGVGYARWDVRSGICGVTMWLQLRTGWRASAVSSALRTFMCLCIPQLAAGSSFAASECLFGS